MNIFIRRICITYIILLSSLVVYILINNFFQYSFISLVPDRLLLQNHWDSQHSILPVNYISFFLFLNHFLVEIEFFLIIDHFGPPCLFFLLHVDWSVYAKGFLRRIVFTFRRLIFIFINEIFKVLIGINFGCYNLTSFSSQSQILLLSKPYFIWWQGL